ncbi:hypothetical protein [uncultured Pseudodesulfovibrio sp.]|uniref:hypothetical protein n=1 Tax=uncultured Pseudodesulfovibrio sp. TaxID=2035858 RepID=UPI0029C60FC8|nr:hypothetical protein [uncultured Pseudodesulfovibrio sp.]
MADRNTLKKDGKLIVVDVAANVVIEAGKMVAMNATGFAVPPADTAGLTVIGKADQRVDNTGGANGDKSVAVERKAAFLMKNSTTSAVTAASIGKVVNVEDSETVATTTTNSIAAGKCLGLEGSGVWIEIA